MHDIHVSYSAEQLSLCSPDSLINREFKQMLTRVRLNQNAQILKIGSTQQIFKFKVNIKTYFQVNLYCSLRLDDFQISCQTNVSDYRLYRMIKECGKNKLLQMINHWNINSQFGEIYRCNPNNVLSMVYRVQYQKNMMGSFERHLNCIWQQLIRLIKSLIEAKNFPLIKAHKCTKLHALKQFFEKNRVNQPGSTKLNIQAKQYDIDQDLHNSLIFKRYKQKLEGYSLKYDTQETVLSQIQIHKQNQYLKEKNSEILEKSYIDIYDFEYTKLIGKFTLDQEDNIIDLYSLSPEAMIYEPEQDQQHINMIACKFRKNKSNSLKKKQPKKQAQLYKQKKPVTFIKCQGLLVEKSKPKQNNIPFEMQLKTIKFLRNSKCPYIASYLTELNGKKIIELQKIYLQFYQRNLTHHLCPSQCLNILRKLIEALYFLSNNGICHRDLKPSNIMIDSEFGPRLIDFGSSAFENYRPQALQIYGYAVRTTRFYNKFYSEIPEEVRRTVNKREYEHHKYFDIYAYGKIIEVIVENQDSKSELGLFVWQNLCYVCDKCTEQNPNDRLDPSEIMMFLDQLIVRSSSTKKSK